MVLPLLGWESRSPPFFLFFFDDRISKIKESSTIASTEAIKLNLSVGLFLFVPAYKIIVFIQKREQRGESRDDLEANRLIFR